MNKLQNVGGAIAPASDLQPALFEHYIAYIDRGEKTTQTYITNLRQFAAWLLFSGIKRPERKDIITYRDYLGADHEAIKLDSSCVNGWRYRTDAAGRPIITKCKPNTIAQYLRCVAQFFRWAAAEGFYPNIADNVHTPKIKNDRHKKDAFTVEELQQIERSICAGAKNKEAAAAGADKDAAGRIVRSAEQGKRLYAMFLLTVNAGLRTVEIERANIKDLSVKGGNAYLYVWGKGHSEADALQPIAKEVYDAIKDYLQSRSDRPNANSPLFVSTGNRSGGQRIKARTISQMLKRAFKDAGYDSERLTAHSLRHTAGTMIMQLTNDIYAAKDYMRHEEVATTQIYTHVKTDEKRRRYAQAMYDHTHGIYCADDKREALAEQLQYLSPEQLQQVAMFVSAMA